jgi:hypothetical protein
LRYLVILVQYPSLDTLSFVDDVISEITVYASFDVGDSAVRVLGCHPLAGETDEVGLAPQPLPPFTEANEHLVKVISFW